MGVGPRSTLARALEEIIRTSKSAAVLVGKDGLGPWQEPEMRACLNEFVKRKLPVIPVLLPGAPAKPDLPLFLQAFTWVDLRSGLTDDGLDRLEWGITGVKPKSAAASLPPVVRSPSPSAGPKMTSKIYWTRQSQADLRAIRQFIARDAPATAAAFVRRLRESVGRLREPWADLFNAFGVWFSVETLWAQ